MNLINLIDYFRTNGSFEAFCQENDLDPASEVVEIFSEKDATIESTLLFLPIEESHGRTCVEKQDVTYLNLFDFHYFLDVIADLKSSPNIDSNKLAARLIDYAKNDA